jgi:hypothetical protein
VSEIVRIADGVLENSRQGEIQKILQFMVQINFSDWRAHGILARSKYHVT